MSEFATAFQWVVGTLNGDATLQALASYDATAGIVWDTEAAQQTTKPIFLVEPQGAADTNNAMGRKRIFSAILLLVKASGFSSDYATLDTMADRADTLLSANPDGQNVFPVQVASGAWILGCERVSPHQLTYDQESKQFTELGGVYAIDVKIK